MTAQFYHNPRCSKSRQALTLLQERGIDATIVDYLATPPSAATLADILRKLGQPARALLRLKEALEENIDPNWPEADLIAAMAACPRVIERPVFVTDTQARIGRPPERVLEIIAPLTASP